MRIDYQFPKFWQVLRHFPAEDIADLSSYFDFFSYIKRVQYLVGIKEEGQRLIMECVRRIKIDHGMWEEGQRLIMEKPFTYSENMTLTQVP